MERTEPPLWQSRPPASAVKLDEPYTSILPQKAHNRNTLLLGRATLLVLFATEARWNVFTLVHLRSMSSWKGRQQKICARYWSSLLLSRRDYRPNWSQYVARAAIAGLPNHFSYQAEQADQ